ncbi:armadillo-type protein [Lipomyces kononenkoae]|uniref:Armadillo-type protein n=1 Tax=Lipomyces kononenkoae TaxID=34357 RepID=A0ACC3T6X8_LIPKO
MPAVQSWERLKFDQPLAPKAGKPIAVSELLKRLQAVHVELSKFDQGSVDLRTVDKVAQDLVSNNLLHHRDKGVRAYVGCCLADILRLYAPDAPYTATQLQSIFEHFVLQMKGLSDPESPYFLQYCYLLESLSQVKSVVLVSDLPNGEDLMADIFTMFFDIVQPDGLKNLEFHMGEILVQLIEEAPTIPSDVITLIIAQFLRAKAVEDKPRSSSNGKGSKVQSSLYQLPPAYNIAKTICINCSDRMSRHISQYFTDVIYDITTKSSADDISDTDLEELKKAHSLIVMIWKAAPEVLQNVIPQLEQELFVDNTQMRIMATETVGMIAGDIPGRVNFTSAHPTCWDAWFGRQNDKNPSVRAKWAEGCAYIIGNRTDVVKGTVEGLAAKLIDNDDKVRLAACKAIGNLDYKCIVRKFRNEQVLNNLAERAKDRKYAVRAEAVKVLGNIYDVAYEDIAANDEEIIAQLAWIPSRIFEIFYLNNKETTVLSDYCIYEQLMPFEADDTKRVTRMLTVVKYLDEKPRKAFNAIPIRQRTMAQILRTYVELCEKYNGGVIEDKEGEDLKGKLDRLIKWMGEQLPDPSKTEAHMTKFYMINDRRMYKLIKDCTTSESDIKTVHKALTELSNRQSAASILETLMPLMYRSSLIFYNRSNIPPIVEASKRTNDGLSAVAHELLKDISTSMPAVLKAHIQDLTQEIQQNQPGFDGSVDTLKACAGFAKRFPGDMPQGRQFLEALANFATSGSPEEAKHAVNIILQSKKREAYARDLLAVATKFDMSDPAFLSQLAILSELVRGASAIVEPEIDKITAFLIKEVLMKNRVKASEDDKDWVDDSQLEVDCKAKILALRIMVNRLRAAEEVEAAKEIAQPVLKLLNCLIVGSGEMSKAQDTPVHFKSRLRLAGGLLLLKLAKIPVYEKMIQPQDINHLAFLVQDRDFQVRQAFIDKLKRYLAADSLPEKYIPIVFLMAYEPEEDVKDELVTWIRARLAMQQQQKTIVMERCFARLLHMLAHHPDYGTDVDDLLDFAQYIIFYMNATVSEQNISLIFYFAQRVKQVRDAISEKTSENLYYMSDLAQAIIRQFEEAHNWSMQTWPGKASLPADLFRAMPSASFAQKIAHTTFLPAGVLERLPQLAKVKTPKLKATPAEKPASISTAGSSGSKKRKKSNESAKKKVKKAPDSDDEWTGK